MITNNEIGITRDQTNKNLLPKHWHHHKVVAHQVNLHPVALVVFVGVFRHAGPKCGVQESDLQVPPDIFAAIF